MLLTNNESRHGANLECTDTRCNLSRRIDQLCRRRLLRLCARHSGTNTNLHETQTKKNFTRAHLDVKLVDFLVLIDSDHHRRIDNEYEQYTAYPRVDR